MKKAILIALLATCFSPCALLADAREDAQRYERQQETRKKEEEQRRIRKEEEKKQEKRLSNE